MQEWIDAVKDSLSKRALDGKQARGMVHDSSMWGRGFVRRNA